MFVEDRDAGLYSLCMDRRRLVAPCSGAIGCFVSGLGEACASLAITFEAPKLEACCIPGLFFSKSLLSSRIDLRLSMFDDLRRLSSMIAASMYSSGAATTRDNRLEFRESLLCCWASCEFLIAASLSAANSCHSLGASSG